MCRVKRGNRHRAQLPASSGISSQQLPLSEAGSCLHQSNVCRVWKSRGGSCLTAGVGLGREAQASTVTLHFIVLRTILTLLEPAALLHRRANHPRVTGGTTSACLSSGEHADSFSFLRSVSSLPFLSILAGHADRPSLPPATVAAAALS